MRTIISIPGASREELGHFKELMEALPANIPIITSADIKLYHIKDDKLYEIVQQLKQIKPVRK